MNTASSIPDAGSPERTRVATERPKDDAGELSVSPDEKPAEASNQKPKKNNPMNKSCISVRETTPVKRLIALAVVAIGSQAVATLAGEPMVSSKQVVVPPPPPPVSFFLAEL